MNTTSFILASASARRREILERIGFWFEVYHSGVAEPGAAPPGEGAVPDKLALTKALAVAQRVTGRLVVGADTTVFLDKIAMGKPANSEDALRMLRLLSGREHTVVTGVALVDDDRTLTGREETTVSFRALTDEELHWYVSTGEPLGKAGSYAIQGFGSALVEWVEGSFLNVVGFPLVLFIRLLEQFTGQSWLRFLKSHGRG
jgi:septum formation protein